MKLRQELRLVWDACLTALREWREARAELYAPPLELKGLPTFDVEDYRRLLSVASSRTAPLIFGHTGLGKTQVAQEQQSLMRRIEIAWQKRNWRRHA